MIGHEAVAFSVPRMRLRRGHGALSLLVSPPSLLCSACDPTVGKWHGEFPREPFEVGHQREIGRWLELSWVQHHPDGAGKSDVFDERTDDGPR